MTSPTSTADNQILDNVQQLLSGLKKTADGEVLHSFIERGLKKFGATRIEAAFLVFADRLLVRYLDSPDSDPGTRIRIKVILQRLRPYLAELPLRPAPVAPATIEIPAPEPTTKQTRTVATACAPEPVPEARKPEASVV